VWSRDRWYYLRKKNKCTLLQSEKVQHTLVFCNKSSALWSRERIYYTILSVVLNTQHFSFFFLGVACQLDAMLSKEGTSVDKVLNFEIADSILEERITGRWIHPGSGRSYPHQVSRRPRRPAPTT